MDATRFEAIFRAHHRAVLGYALRRADPDTAQEVVADTFLVCWRRLEDVPPDARPWLFGVARRCLANRRRGAERQRALEARVAEPGTAGDAFGERLDIHAAFRRLSERDREALALVAWEGLDHAAAARALGCSRAAFAVRFHRARRRLAAQLAEPPTAPESITETA
jgi:RNA polymerase sigma-70 factor, ECF subfamily